MNDRLIVDTDILIDVGRGVAEAVHCLKQIENTVTMAISVVSQMELVVGCRNKKELESLEGFLEKFQVVKLDVPISDKAIDLLKSYRLSHGLLIADALIAATAMTAGLDLISKNQRDYRFIDGIGLVPYPNPFQ